MDTQDTIVPDPVGGGPDVTEAGEAGDGSDAPPEAAEPHDAAARRPRWRMPRWARRTLFVASFIVLALVVADLIKVPYYLLSPGSVRRTEDLIQVDGAPTYPTDEGSVGYTTVTVGQASALTWALAHLDSSIDIEPAKAILGSQTPSQNLQTNLQMMTDSKESASVVALRHLGYQVSAHGTGAVIVRTVDGSPGAGVLHPGDTVTAVDGVPVQLSEDLVRLIGTHKPGDQVTLTVAPLPADDGTAKAEEARTVTLGTRPADPDHPADPATPPTAFLGVSSATRDLSYPDMPVQVKVDSGTVGGPSAGLAFTLGIMDVLTKGSITGGHKVATTGTMQDDGTIGPVGGVHQKTLTVRASGAEVFFVPESEYAEAKRYAGSLLVVPVKNIDDVLKVLAGLGGGTDVLPAGG